MAMSLPWQRGHSTTSSSISSRRAAAATDTDRAGLEDFQLGPLQGRARLQQFKGETERIAMHAGEPADGHLEALHRPL